MLNDLVYCLGLSVCLRVSWRGLVIVDPIFLAQFSKFSVVELCSVVNDDGVWYSKPVQDVFFHKAGSICFYYMHQRLGFYLLREIVH